MYFNDYKNNLIHTNGDRHSFDAQNIVENTWYDDPNSMVAYFYDYYHDDEPDKNIGLHPENSKTKIPVDIKYNINSYQSMEKDTVDYRIMFKPSYTCSIPYYKEKFENIVHSSFPTGLYLDKKNEKGIWERWLVVAEANVHNNDFPTWSILPCDYKYQWIFKGKKYEMWGVGRSQNSYNAGIWAEYRTERTENQTKFILPYNDISKNIFYKQRMVVSVPLPEPIVWRITKVEGLNSPGVIHYTLYQDMWNNHTDVIELNEDGEVVGMWADFKQDRNLPTNTPMYTEPELNGNYGKITYAGKDPHIKVNGSYKAVTVSYYNSNELLRNQTPGDWSYFIDDTDATDLVKVIEGNNSNTIKIKFLGDEEYLGKVLTIKNTRDNIVAELQLEIVAL